MKRETFDATATATTVEPLAPVARFSLRVRKAGRDEIGRALGIDLPRRIGQCARGGDRIAVRLGPDEWLLTAPEDQAGAIVSAAAEAFAATPHALAEISDREVGYRIEGPEAVTLLSLGAPRDLRDLASGEAVRTVFDGASVILWRDGPDAFRLDVWRSFAPHVHALLQTGIEELRSGF